MFSSLVALGLVTSASCWLQGECSRSRGRCLWKSDGGFVQAPLPTNSYPTSDEWAWPGPGSRWRRREPS